MNNEKLEQLKEIVANAPDSATHYGNGFYYTYSEVVTTEFISYEWREWKNNKSSFVKTQLAGFHNPRSLSDIKTIIVQAERIKELEAQISEAYVYLDSFLFCERESETYCGRCGYSSNNEVDFNEAQKALDILGKQNEYK